VSVDRDAGEFAASSVLGLVDSHKVSVDRDAGEFAASRSDGDRPRPTSVGRSRCRRIRRHGWFLDFADYVLCRSIEMPANSPPCLATRTAKQNTRCRSIEMPANSPPVALTHGIELDFTCRSIEMPANSPPREAGDLFSRRQVSVDRDAGEFAALPWSQDHLKVIACRSIEMPANSPPIPSPT